MELPVDTGVVERIEPEIAKYGDAGLHEWRTLSRSPVDAVLLGQLPAVKACLTALGEGAGDEPDARLDAIDAAIGEAVDRLPQPYGSAAREYFWLRDLKVGVEAPTKGTRELEAARCFPRITTKRWFGKANSKYLGMEPRQLVVALVTCALCGVSDPMAYVSMRESGVAPPTSSDPPSSDPPDYGISGRGSGVLARPPLVLAAAAILAAGVVAALIATGFPGSESTPSERAFTRSVRDGSVPLPRGWAVDAQTGEPVAPASLPKRFGPNGGQLGGGNVFCPCVMQRQHRVGSQSSREPTYAMTGERLLFRLRLHDPSNEALAEARIWIATRIGGNRITLTANMEWPTTTPIRLYLSKTK